jgi:hypothetical protein
MKNRIAAVAIMKGYAFMRFAGDGRAGIVCQISRSDVRGINIGLPDKFR